MLIGRVFVGMGSETGITASYYILSNYIPKEQLRLYNALIFITCTQSYTHDAILLHTQIKTSYYIQTLIHTQINIIYLLNIPLYQDLCGHSSIYRI